MKKLGLSLLVLLGLPLALELVLRWMFPTEIEPTHVWVDDQGLERLRPGLDGYLGPVSWATDEQGQRVGLERRDGSFEVLVLGSEFTAGVGVDTAVHFATRLERLLQTSQNIEGAVVSARIARGSLLRRLEDAQREIESDPPDVVVLQVAAADVGGDEGPWVQSSPPEPRTASAWALLDLLRRTQDARTRGEAEEALRDLVERDGICGRAVDLSRDHMVEFQRAWLAGELRDSPLVRGVLYEKYAVERQRELAAVAKATLGFFDQLKRIGIHVLWMAVGPGELVRPVELAARELNIRRVQGPPSHLDPALTIAETGTSSFVHEVWADCLLSALIDGGFLPTSVSDTPEVERAAYRASKIHAFYARNIGQVHDRLRLVRNAVTPVLSRSGLDSPAVFGGLADGGQLVPGVAFQFALQAKSPSMPLEVRCSLPEEPTATVSFRVSVWIGDQEPVTCTMERSDEVDDGRPVYVGRIDAWPPTIAPLQNVGFEIQLADEVGSEVRWVSIGPPRQRP